MRNSKKIDVIGVAGTKIITDTNWKIRNVGSGFSVFERTIEFDRELEDKEVWDVVEQLSGKSPGRTEITFQVFKKTRYKFSTY